MIVPISAFELLGIQNESKFLLFHLAFRLLDPGTRDRFQNIHRDTEFPKFDQLFKFIKDYCFSIQLTANTNSTFDTQSSSSGQKQNSSSKFNRNDSKDNFKTKGKASLVAQTSGNSQVQKKQQNSSDNPPPCFICKQESHGLLSCRKVCTEDVNQRIAWLDNFSGCRNCLFSTHQISSC